jgi:membrane-bound lytic murein transglycosylase D
MSLPRTLWSLACLLVLVSSHSVTAQTSVDPEQQSEGPPILEVYRQELAAQAAAAAAAEALVTQDVTTVQTEIAPLSLDIPINARVQSFVNLLTGRLKGFLEEGLSRGTRFLPMIEEVFRAEGIPLELVYVPLVESAFKPTALSPAKAKGMWQFMPGTASDHGLKRDWWVDERSDVEKATRAAAVYLKTLANMFGGDWHLALASYNAGPGRVQRAMRRSGRTDYWSLSASSRFLPRETREYVPQILAAVLIARNPAEYGLTVAPPGLPLAERITVPGALDLRRIAEWAEVPVELLQNLNPELRRWTTPVRATDYELKVPDGSAELVRARLAEGMPEERGLPAFDYYTVRKGDTLQSIAKRLKVSRTDLAEANYLSTKARVSNGQQLIVPKAPVFLSSARFDVLAASEETSSPADYVAPSAFTQPAEPEVEAAVKRVHRVKAGDTLFSISQQYDTDVASLREWNHLRGSVIKVGQRLTVSPGSDLATH